jgi:hypothetical protein
LNGNANNAPLNYAAGLDLRQYEEVLAVLGLKGKPSALVSRSKLLH